MEHRPAAARGYGQSYLARGLNVPSRTAAMAIRSRTIEACLSK
jgi:hypothetical protein